MRFAVDVVPECGVRCGKLTLKSAVIDAVIDTPACTLYTKAGRTPYLTDDMLDRITELPLIAHMPLPKLLNQNDVMARYKKGIREYTSMKKFAVFHTLQDPAQSVPSGFNNKTSVATWNRNGRVSVDVETFMSIQQNNVPDLYETLCDADLDASSSRKRCSKAVNNTLTFLDQCIAKHKDKQELASTSIIAPVVGAPHVDELVRCAREVSTRAVHGYSLSGMYKYDIDSNKQQFSHIQDSITKAVEQLPSDKPRFMCAVWHPCDVLDAVKLGIDVFDSSYPYVVTLRNEALVFNFDTKNQPSNEQRPFQLNLKDTKYMNEDECKPILAGCSCYTCTNHSRVYVSHLINTSELLASILLMIHNFHHYFGFFRTLRASAKDGTFHILHENMRKYRQLENK